MQRAHAGRHRADEALRAVVGELRDAHAEHAQARQAGQHAPHEVPRAVAEVEPLEPAAPPEEQHHALEERRLVGVADHDEAERLQMRQDGVPPLDDVVAPEHDARRARALERPVQGQRAQVLCVRDAREHEVRDARVHEVEVRELLDRRGLERRVPGVVAQEVRAEGEVHERALVLVEHGAHLVHVGKAVVVLGAQRKFAEITEARHAFGVKVPASTCPPSVSVSLNGEAVFT